MSENALEISHLVKNYGSLCAVNKVSFEVKPGEIFGLLGPNGAGKTTIISSINTLETPTSGTVKVFGCDVAQETRQAKFLTGCVPQELIQHGFFTTEEILNIHSGYYGLNKNGDQVTYLLQKLNLYEHRHKTVKQLSGGMKRRLLIAKALVHKPKLLLLDEPTAGVDIELRLTLYDFIRELKEEGLAILLTTHYLEEAEELCDRVGIINLGEIKTIGGTREIISEVSQKGVTFLLNRELPFLQNPWLVSQTPESIELQVPMAEEVGTIIEKLAIPFEAIRDIRIREATLEDAFKKILVR